MTNTAWQLSASYVLFGGKAAYERLKLTFTGERTAFTGGAAEGGSRPTEFVFFNRVQVSF